MRNALRAIAQYRVLLVLIFLCIPVLTCCTRAEGPAQAPPRFQMSNSFFNVFFTDAKKGWAVGKLGTLVHTDNGGSYWGRQNSITDCNLRGLYFTDDKTGWVVGDRGIIRHTTDGGRTWAKQDSGTEHHLRSVFFFGPDKGFIVGEQGIFLYTENGGKEWKKRTDLKEYLTVEDVSLL